MHQHSNSDGQNGLEADVVQHILDRDPECIPEKWVLRQPGVIVEADESGSPKQAVLGQTVVESSDRGVEVEHHEADQRRQNKNQGYTQVVTTWGPARPLALTGREASTASPRLGGGPGDLQRLCTHGATSS